jgi:hypothetical protein
MMTTQKSHLPGLIESGRFDRIELHGFEVDMSGRVIAPEFHPPTPEEVSASLRFESELRAAIDAAA